MEFENFRNSKYVPNDNFSRSNTKFGIVQKFHIYSTMINIEHMIYWGYIYIAHCRRFHSKILSCENLERAKKRFHGKVK